MPKTIFSVGLVALFLAACSVPQNDKNIEPAFYYWKSNFLIKDIENQVLKSNTIKKIYVKYFDLDVSNGQVLPQAKVQFSSILDTSFNIVPCVFITNKSLLTLQNDAQVKLLARRIYDKILVTHFKKRLTEIQIDCDWSLRTRGRYFKLLTLLKGHLPSTCLLSATIRLHQIKFPEKTGVPPIDRGMLMCYNMADWKNIKTPNSIFDPAVIEQYTQNLSQYPLPLDVVFPVFRWAIIYRNNQFLKFINNLDNQRLTSCNFLENTTQNRFVAKADTLAFGTSLRKGDVLRTENANFDDLIKEKAAIFQKISNQKLTFALFHLDSLTLSAYSNAQIKNLLQSSF